MRDNYFRTGEGFLCVYSVTMRDTFEQVGNFVEQIIKVTEDETVKLRFVHMPPFYFIFRCFYVGIYFYIYLLFQLIDPFSS